MNLLLDSHALIWFLNGDSRLSSNAKKSIEDPANQNFVSIATVWEIAIKNSLGKLNLTRPLSELPGQLHQNGFDLLPVEFRHIFQVNRLPFHHRDPFDRIIIAQALEERMTIVGLDPEFPAYGVPVLW